MITNISDHKDTSFLSINKTLSNKIKLSLLKNGVFLYFEQHFHKFLERCSILKYNNIVCCPKNNCQDIFCKNHCTLIYFLWCKKVKLIKSSPFSLSIESTSSLLNHFPSSSFST